MLDKGVVYGSVEDFSIQNVQRIMDGRMYPVTIAGLERAMKSLA